MKRLKCSENCGCELFEVSLTVDSYKALAEIPERVDARYYTCSSCGAPAEEYECDL